MVTPHVDTRDGQPREREGRALDDGRRAEVREHRAVMIAVRVNVEEADALVLDGVPKSADQFLIAPLTDVRNGF